MSGNYPAGVTGNESHFYPDTTATCAECGVKFDVEQEVEYGISRDGERYCCFNCISDVTRLSSIHYSDRRWGASAEVGTGLGRVTVEALGRSQAQALKEAEDCGEMINEGVNAYITEG